MLLSCYGTREVRLLLYCITAQKFIFGLAISTMLRRQEKHSLIPFFVMRDVSHCKLKVWQDST